MKYTFGSHYILGVLISSCMSGCANAQHGDIHSAMDCGNMNISDKERILLAETDILVLKDATPQYPTSPYKRETYKGCVLLSFDINMNGKAENIRIIRFDSDSSTFFSRAAMKAVEKYEFKKVVSKRDALLLLSFDLKIDENLK